MKIGLYFGSFNPIHVGHLNVAKYFVENTDLDQVWLVVSPQSPHKDREILLAEDHRLLMVNTAIKGIQNLKALDIEFGLSKPNYTIKTLKHLERKHKGNTFFILMGEDNIRGFYKWFNYEEILMYYKIYVYPRQNRIEEFDKQNKNSLLNHKNVFFFKEAPLITISSSHIRDSILHKKNIRNSLEDEVYKYIKKNSFYIESKN